MSEIGRYELASFAGFPGLRIGTTMALFHCSGTKPVVYDKLSSFRRLFLLDSVRLVSILLWIRSAPTALLGRFFRA